MANGNGNGNATTSSGAKVQLRRADARRWKKQSTDGQWVTLPGSGEPALLKRPSLMAMAANAGHVPNPLSAEVIRFLAENGDPLRNYSKDERAAIYKKNSRAFVEIAKLTFLDPKIVEDREPDYDAGEIAPTDIGDFDYSWLIFNFVEGDASKLVPFLIADSDGTDVPDSIDVRAAA